MSKFIGGYYVNWKGFNYSISKLPIECNQIYLFHGKPLGNGNIYFDIPGEGFIEDCILALKQGKRLILSVGGAQFGFNLNNKTESDNFIESVKNILTKISGSSKNVKLGLDWNNFEAEIMPSTVEIIYVSKTLKQFYNDFVITSPVAPWKQQDKEWAIAMNNAGCLDYVSPQYYDGPSLNNTSYVVENIESWIKVLGENRVGLGFGINSPTNTGYYWSGQEMSNCLKIVLQKWPGIRGAFSWEIIGDIESNSGFIDIVSKVFKQPGPQKGPKIEEKDSDFIFYKGCDTFGGEIRLIGKTIQELKEFVKNTPGAVGFNTNGYIKTTFINPIKESTFTDDSEGLYVLPFSNQIIMTHMRMKIIKSQLDF